MDTLTATDPANVVRGESEPGELPAVSEDEFTEAEYAA